MLPPNHDLPSQSKQRVTPIWWLSSCPPPFSAILKCKQSSPILHEPPAYKFGGNETQNSHVFLNVLSFKCYRIRVCGRTSSQDILFESRSRPLSAEQVTFWISHMGQVHSCETCSTPLFSPNSTNSLTATIYRH